MRGRGPRWGVLKRSKKGNKSYLPRRGPNEGRGPRCKMARNRQRETSCSRAGQALHPQLAGGRGRVGSALRRWLGPPTRRQSRPSFSTQPSPGRVLGNWGHIPQTPCQKGTPPLTGSEVPLPSQGQALPCAGTSNRRANARRGRARVGGHGGRVGDGGCEGIGGVGTSWLAAGDRAGLVSPTAPQA